MSLYVYWTLVTQDLLKWADDRPHAFAKTILIECWTRLKRLVRGIESDRENEAGNLDNLKVALEDIKRFADFDSETKLTSACLDVVRKNLWIFWGELPREDWKMWEIFMKVCRIHHVLCNNTHSVIKGRIKNVIELITTRYNERNLRDEITPTSLLYGANSSIPRIPKGRSVFTPKVVQQMFGIWIRNKRKITNNLCINIDNLVFTLCRSTAAHIVMNGIYVIEITECQLVGFVRKYIIAADVLDSIPIIGTPSIVDSIKKTIIATVLSMLPDAGISKTTKERTPSISSGGMILFMQLIRHVISTADYGVVQGKEPFAFKSEVWSKRFADAIDTYLETHHTSVRDVDGWPIMAEPDLNIYDDEGCLVQSVEDCYEADSEDERDDCASTSEYSTESSDSEDELTKLKRRYPTLPRAPVQVIGTRQTKTSSKSKVGRDVVKEKSSVSLKATTPGPGCSSDPPFTLDETAKLFRSMCVLCFKKTAKRSLVVSDETAIACCQLCLEACNGFTNRAEIAKLKHQKSAFI